MLKNFSNLINRFYPKQFKQHGCIRSLSIINWEGNMRDDLKWSVSDEGVYLTPKNIHHNTLIWMHGFGIYIYIYIYIGGSPMGFLDLFYNNNPILPIVKLNINHLIGHKDYIAGSSHTSNNLTRGN